MIFLFLSSGLFLGWSLGANDAANVFGSAVGSKMLKFRTAALICGAFVIIGAVVGGSGAARTLGQLGAVDAIAGAFTVAFAAALAVYWMTKVKLPISTSQSVVGAIIGWNLFAGRETDYGSLTKIVSTWILCPILAAIFAIIFFKLFKLYFSIAKPHLLVADSLTRWGLIIVGAFGSYALGANNVANVIGVFLPVSPFKDVGILGLFSITSAQQLFLLGGLAIAVGVFTYSKKVMQTVGRDLCKLTPEIALIVVLAHSVVLFIFASPALEAFLHGFGLPAFPLVPVSSSQAVVGAIIGIGILKGGRGVKYHVLGKIVTGWIATPVIACLVTYFSLFIMQNVFDLQVFMK